MVTTKWLFTHLTRSKRKSEIDRQWRRSNKIEGVSWPKPSHNLPSAVRNFWTFSSQASYIFPRRAGVCNRTDSWCQCLRFRKRPNVRKFFVFEWWRVEIGRGEFLASLLCITKRVSTEKVRKTSIGYQVTALPIFESQLDISIHICVHHNILQGQKLADFKKDHFFLRTPSHNLSDVFFFFF